MKLLCTLSVLLTITTGYQSPAMKHLERGKQLYWNHCTDSIERSGIGRQEALGELQRAIRLDPDLAETHLYLGRLYQCMAADYKQHADATAKAIEHFRLAAQLAPDDPVIHYELAASLNPETDATAMISELRTSLALFEGGSKPTVETTRYTDYHAEAMWLLGVILKEKSQTLEEGFELMEKAIAKIDNRDLTISKRDRLASAYMEKGRYHKALKWYETLLPNQAIEEIIQHLKRKIEQKK